MIQLSLTMGVIGRDNTESLQRVYVALMKDYTHEQVEDKLLDMVQEKFEDEIEDYCNRNMIYSNLRVAEDIVEELKKLNT